MTRRRLTPDELRAQVQHLTAHNRQLVTDLRGCRDALRQQQRHIRQLVRALDTPTARNRRGRS